MTCIDGKEVIRRERDSLGARRCHNQLLAFRGYQPTRSAFVFRVSPAPDAGLIALRDLCYGLEAATDVDDGGSWFHA